MLAVGAVASRGGGAAVAGLVVAARVVVEISTGYFLCANHGSLITWLNDSLCARAVKILRLKTKFQTHSERFICLK